MPHTPPEPVKIKKTFGSLALRVASVFFVLIIIPLSLYIIFTYDDVYYKQIDDIYFNLFEEKKEVQTVYTTKQNDVQTVLTFFSELNEYNSRFVGPNYDFDLHHEGGSLGLRQIFTKVQKQFKLSSILFVGKEQNSNEWLSWYSTDSDLVCKSFKELFPQLHQFNGKAFVAQTPQINTSVFFPFYTTDITLEKEREGYNIGVLTLNELLSQMVKEINNPWFLTDVTLIDQQGKVLSSSNPSVRKGAVVNEKNLKAYKDRKDAFIFTNKEATFYAVMAPLIPGQLNVLLSVPHSLVLHLLHEYYFKISVIFIVILIIGGGLCAFLYFRVSYPLKHLCRTMMSVGEGDLSVKYKKDWWGCELNIIGESFNGMIRSLTDYLEKNRELALGKKIQETILPQTSPDIPFFDTAFIFKPAHDLGGDVFDFFFIEKWDKHLFFIGDTSGKGLDASLYSLTFRAILKTAFESASNLVDGLIEANSLFKIDAKETGFFVTAWIGLFDAKTKELDFICCGHNPAFLNREGTIVSLPQETSLPAIGTADYTQQTVKSAVQKFNLNKEDTLLLYTDGLTDANNPQKEMFGAQQVRHILQTTPFESAQELIDKVYQQVEGFVDGEEQFDDITMIAIQVKEEKK